MRKPPLLWPPRGLSEQETNAIKWLNATMHGLLASTDAWEAALALYKVRKTRPPQVKADIARRWQWIAIHECVMQIAYRSSPAVEVSWSKMLLVVSPLQPGEDSQGCCKR